jgi:hypothetical protein
VSVKFSKPRTGPGYCAQAMNGCNVFVTMNPKPIRYITLSALACLLALAPVLLAAPQDKNAAPLDPTMLLSRATQRTNIESPASLSFVLVAKVKYTQNQQTTEGTYTIGWAGPSLYREDFRLADYTETIVNANGKLYRATSTENRPAAIELWAKMLNRPLSWNLPQGTRAKAKDVPTQFDSRADLACVVADHNGTHERICLDPNDYEPYTYDINGPSGKVSWTFSDYTFLANDTTATQRFPTAIIYKDGSGVSAEIDIQSLAAVPGFVADEFTPPANAKPVASNADLAPAGNRPARHLSQLEENELRDRLLRRMSLVLAPASSL